MKVTRLLLAIIFLLVMVDGCCWGNRIVHSRSWRHMPDVGCLEVAPDPQATLETVK